MALIPTAVVLRPKIGTHKPSGTIIVARDAQNVELKKGEVFDEGDARATNSQRNSDEEFFDEGDALAMSPRRKSDDLEKMIQEARAQLSQDAKLLDESLLEILNRIKVIKEQLDKLDSNNRFLQN
ncbi:hypothetical protein VE02_05809 [Pseudogymnoascus sp. 03VT05]|nr:hypothetical protein VE02_05809 [Pseudogymnoascus sp. 03VT05]